MLDTRPSPPLRLPADVADRARRLRTWYEAFSKHFESEAVNRFGPRGVWETITGYAASGRPPSWPTKLDERDPVFIELVFDLARAVGRYYFRWNVSGQDHIPASGAAMLVGNHNGGVMPTDTLLTMLAIWDRFGPSRAVHPLGHDLLWQDALARKLVAKLGILRAHPNSAALALDAGHLLLVYPGSDLDSWRPWTHRARVQLGNRKGFIRTALRHRVPIIPVVSAGTHEQIIMLTTGRRIARRLGLKRLIRSEAFPVMLALP
ncbi:MAG: lysophospholipid acyltransferase family protein, partial [Myxococcota bacterium]